MRPGDSLFAIYLHDHYAAATGGLELARRTASSNLDGELGSFLRELAREIAEDRATLGSLMSGLGVGRDRLKVAATWAAEKLGRLKLNGRLTGYSPLSRVIELEGLIAGVSAKLALWATLRELSPQDPRLDGARLGGLMARAERQRERLHEHHRRAVALAFSPA